MGRKRGKWYYYRGDPLVAIRLIEEERRLRRLARAEMRKRSGGRRISRTKPSELIIWDGPTEFEGLKAERKKELQRIREK